MAEETKETSGSKEAAEEKKETTTEPGGSKAATSTEEPFDKDRAMETIKKQRETEAAAVKRAKELEAKVKEFEDASKSEQEKLAEAKEQATTDAAEAKRDAARLRVALKKGLTESQAKRLVGDDEEALEKDADELLESFKADEGEEPKRRPKERLRPGAAPSSEPEENDPAKLAEQVPRSW